MTAAEFFTLVQPAPQAGEMIEARYLSPTGDGHPIQRFHASVASLLRELPHYRATHHCYTGVCLRRGRNGTAAGVSRAGACWADIDAKLWRSERDPKAAALAAIERCRIRVGVLIDSGGGYQPYVPLAAPWDLPPAGARERLQRINRALARAICGPDRSPDHMHDVARVLRIPGSLNLKPEYGVPRPVTIVWVEPEQCYALDELEAALQQYYPGALEPVKGGNRRASSYLNAVPMPDTLPADAPERLHSLPLRRETRGLLDSTGAAGMKSASEADMALACGLVGAGLTAGEALAALLSSVRGRAAEERKGNRWRQYWEITVTAAAAYVGPVTEHRSGLRVRSAAESSRGIRTVPAQEAAAWLR